MPITVLASVTNVSPLSLRGFCYNRAGCDRKGLELSRETRSVLHRGFGGGCSVAGLSASRVAARSNHIAGTFNSGRADIVKNNWAGPSRSPPCRHAVEAAEINRSVTFIRGRSVPVRPVNLGRGKPCPAGLWVPSAPCNPDTIREAPKIETHSPAHNCIGGLGGTCVFKPEGRGSFFGRVSSKKPHFYRVDVSTKKWNPGKPLSGEPATGPFSGVGNPNTTGTSQTLPHT